MLDSLGDLVGNLSHSHRLAIFLVASGWFLVSGFAAVFLHKRMARRYLAGAGKLRPDLLESIARSLAVVIAVFVLLSAIAYFTGAVVWLVKNGVMSHVRSSVNVLFLAIGGLGFQLIELLPTHWISWLDN
ncbi:MAG: hypothetical protein JNL50_12960 [Phycisphaerae bacterium]|nr:hypothetical protein [Phycisphaerae bacterium]